ncbi:hypothetical protein ACWD6R_08780 [Streptomyces sp. NPDC005151]
MGQYPGNRVLLAGGPGARGDQLLGMCLCSAMHSGAVVLSTVADLLAFGISDRMRDRFGVPHYADNDRGFEALYAVVRRLFHNVVGVVDPSPLPKNHRIDVTDAAKLRAQADQHLLDGKRALLLRIFNKILGMSLHPAHALLEGITWTPEGYVTPA